MPTLREPSVDVSELDPVLDFMRLLWSIEHGLQRMSKRMENEIGITGPQRLVLRVVGQYPGLDRKSTRLNSSHSSISYAVFCLKKKNKNIATFLRPLVF